jgi:hypothetical protein
MKQGQRLRIVLGLVATVVVAAFAAGSGFAQAPVAPPQTPPAAAPQAPTPPTVKLSAAQLQKIDGWIADKGREIAVTPIITEILGLTKDGETITCRAFAAEGDADEVHQIYLLPEGKGYLEAHFYQNKLDIYWIDKDFALKAAVEGVHGQLPAAVSFADAQYGFSFEAAWWAKYTDAH